MNPIPAITLGAAALLCASAASASEWRDLVPAEGLDGWTRRGGEAVYWNEGGVIVGETRPDTPNSFLCTDEHFADFILEYEFLVDPRLNSGVQIRSHSDPEYRGGIVHGYQVEIDPSPRAWSAGIFDEGRRGWLASLAENQPAREAFRQDEWNHTRVEAVGHSIRTWINGVEAADLVDGMTASGFIGLQVHSVRMDDPLQVRFRNVRLREVPFRYTVRIENKGEEAFEDLSFLVLVPREHGPAPGRGLLVGEKGSDAHTTTGHATEEGFMALVSFSGPIQPGGARVLHLMEGDAPDAPIRSRGLVEVPDELHITLQRLPIDP